MSDVEPPPQTQSTAVSNRVYNWVFLFNFDLDNEFPFTCVLLEHLKRGPDFPFHLISGHLGLADRLKPREFSGLQGGKYCVFSKIELGKISIFIY